MQLPGDFPVRGPLFPVCTGVHFNMEVSLGQIMLGRLRPGPGVTMSEASAFGMREAAAQHYGFVSLCERLPSKRSGATCPGASSGGFVSEALGGLPSI